MRPESLLADANPVPDPDAAVDPRQSAELLERLLATPVRPARRGRRRLVVATAAAAVAIAAVALIPSFGGSPDVLARAAAALNQPDTILHFKAEIHYPGARERTAEVWQTAGARQLREIDDAGEYVEDWATKTALSYNAQRDELVRHTEPDLFNPAKRAPRGTDAPNFGAANITDDLARLFERARNGDDKISLLGETTIRDIPVYELRIEFTILTRVVKKFGGTARDARRAAPVRKVRLLRRVYVDRERFLPVRIVDQGLVPGGDTVTDYVLAERLPRTPDNEALLRMAPHPGAKQVVGRHF